MTMTKEQIIESILLVSRNLKLEVATKCKSEKWSADIVVNCDTYKVAFNICKSPRNVEETYKTMREERICGCWLLMPAKNSVFLPNNMPCFKLSEKSDAIQVFLNSEFDDDNSNVIALDAFIPSLIRGNIRFAQRILVKYIEVCFVDMQCWKCHKENQVYFINRLRSSDGISVPYNNASMDELEFNPLIIKSIAQYITTHPESGIKMGKIKPRFSKTVGESYPSFGCAYCDSIFGNHFVQEAMLEMRYYSNSLPKAQIEIQGEIYMPADCWYIKE